MDPVSRAFYELAFEIKFLKLKGNEFQAFFSSIMEKCHPGDFVRVRPWGRIGDRKNDGYLKSERTLFQVYSPNEFTLRDTLNKIEQDFREALPHWREHLNKWVFVHNSRDGLSADVLNKLLSLEMENPGIKVEAWGYEELRRKVFTLSEDDLASLLGVFAPTRRDIMKVGYSELKLVLQGIRRMQRPEPDEVRPVPPEKLEYNKLSDSVEILLKAGMTKASLVERFFREWHDPTYGPEIAAAFRAEYEKLKAQRKPPDEIYMALLEFAGGTCRGSAEEEAGVLAVLAYLFETCGIFEEPPRREPCDCSFETSQ